MNGASRLIVEESSTIMDNTKNKWRSATARSRRQNDIISKIAVTEGISVKKPEIVFSVIGDSESFVPKPWPKSVLQNAITDAVKNAGDSWIIFEGRYISLEKKKLVGVSAILQESAREYERVTFYNNEGEKQKPQNNEKSSTPRMQLIVINRDVDDGLKDDVLSGYVFSKERRQAFISTDKQVSIKLKDIDTKDLLELETEISKSKSHFQSSKVSIDIRIPILIIVVEGDLDTIVHVADAVKAKLPVLIVKGTGKAADLIIEYIENSDSDNNCLQKKAPVLFGLSFNQESFNTLKSNLETIRKTDWLVCILWKINIFDIYEDDPTKISQIAGEAIITAWAMENLENRQTPINGNNNLQTGNTMENSGPMITHVVKSVIKVNKDAINDNNDQRRFVLTSKCTSPASLPLYFYVIYQALQEKKQGSPAVEQKDLEETLLLEALKANRSDYVQVLLDQGVKFNHSNFTELYKTTVKCESCDKDNNCLHMEWILKNENKKLCEGLFTESTRENAKKLCGKILDYKKSKIDGGDELLKHKDEEKVISDLLLWSLYANRKETSEILWKLTYNPLLTAVMSSELLKKLSERASDVKEHNFAASLLEHAKLFEKRSISMLDKMYDQNPKVAVDIIDETQHVWDVTTSALTFAHENFMYDFIAHICTQKWLNKKCYKELPPDLLPFIKSMCSDTCNFITAPITRFMINYFMFLIMLISYSAYIMTSIDDQNYTRIVARMWEYYTYFWALADLFMTIYIAFFNQKSAGRSSRGMWSKFKRFIWDFWNAVDFLSYILLIAALFVRHFYKSETYALARRLFSLSLLVMYLRFLQVFVLARTLGPLLIMIKEMLKDLIAFLCIAIVVIVGVGVYYHANLYPNQLAIFGPGNYDTWSIWKVFYYPYFQLYGELFNDYLAGEDGSDCTTNSTIYNNNGSAVRCTTDEWSVPVVSAFYMLISNLLLVNLVIAMFSYTFEKVQENSEKLWRFQRYTVITDYEAKVPSPFSYIIVPVWVLLCCFSSGHNKCCKSKTQIVEEIKASDLKKRHMEEIQRMIASRC